MNPVIAGVFFGSPPPGVTPPPSAVPTPPPSGTSADGTLVPPAGQVVDAAGAIWTLAANQGILRNGALAGGGYGTKLLWSGSILYTFGLNNTWWQWTGSRWSNVGTTQPGSVVTPPVRHTARRDTAR